MSTPFLFCEDALLPSGWARDVALYADADGMLERVEVGAEARGVPRAGGPVVPGLPNVHSHAFQRAMAGRTHRYGPAEDSFWTWRTEMYRFVERLTPEDVEAVATWLYVDLLKHGYTAVGEFHYLHHGPDGALYDDPAELSHRIVAAAETTGLGLTLLPVLYTTSGFEGGELEGGQRRFGHTLDGYARLLQRLADAYPPAPHRRLGIAPHSLRAVPPEALAALPDVAAPLGPDAPVHIHVAEQTAEVKACLAHRDARPVAWLLDHADVDARWCCIHATHMDESETQRLAASGAVAGLCPTTEADLGDGLFPLPAFLEAGGSIAIGSDSHARIDPAEELRLLEYGQRLTRRQRNVARVEGAASVGAGLFHAVLAGGTQALAQPIGRLEPGRRADCVVLDGTAPLLAELHGDAWLDAYIFAGGPPMVRDVFVAGRQVVTEGHHPAEADAETAYLKALARLVG